MSHDVVGVFGLSPPIASLHRGLGHVVTGVIGVLQVATAPGSANAVCGILGERTLSEYAKLVGKESDRFQPFIDRVAIAKL